jgi:hypothetical protein
MLTKMIAALTLIAALGTGAYAMSNNSTSTKKVGIVEVTELDWYVDGAAADCEVSITPNSVTMIKGGESC